jgi:hypothetical protein
MATSAGSSYLEDAFSTLTVETDYVWGGHATLGGRFGQNKNIFIYGLLGFVGIKTSQTAEFTFAPTETAQESGTGVSIGAAAEVGITDTLGIRLKVLHNMYAKGESGIKVRDSSAMAGLVINF